MLSRYTQDGKKPASNTPRMTLKPAICCQFFMNPIPIMQHPHSVVTPERCNLGPRARTMMVDGGWNTTYVMKKTRVMMDYQTRSIFCPEIFGALRDCFRGLVTHISFPDKKQFGAHASDVCSTKIRPVHEGDAVHNS